MEAWEKLGQECETSAHTPPCVHGGAKNRTRVTKKSRVNRVKSLH